ncbi:MAG: Eco57I restriction-modification methylase domain-containing protein, partial [Paludibacter sp.]|nr:Eco57I restriction-modification methylase domain-containing protein [Paludibacter sp.]
SGGYKTDFFYNEIAAPAIEAIKHEITFTHFDIRNYEKPLRNTDAKDDNVLIALFKLLSPEHLLKLPFANDSNSLDKTFYTELLHIIGLVETKEGGKKLIQRKKEGERHAGSLIEGAIFQLDSLDKISRLEKPMQYGENHQERLFNVALELSITWINRILFLKLLEAQLLKYNKNDKRYSFLNMEKIQNFDDLNNLFFSVLARRPHERNDKVKTLFEHVPYLNSSLFEPTEVEHSCLFISQLKDEKLPLLSTSVIKDNTGKKRTGEMITVDYLFEFLNAYDFASEGSEEIQEDNKKLINASVLGLIFEKINGYKDGSFFTPGFITMYMCRETIRRAMVQKFNDAKGWNCKNLHDLYNKIEDIVEANAIINSLKLCDPAVGSGHFLVSALNEIIAIKSELHILIDRNNKRLKEYNVIVENDELIVTDEDGKLFEYNPKSPESQRVQETLFHEKQTIIENCLFGVDLNPNSVKICRLRLWIELLKNAYYRAETRHATSLPEIRELETLPNIDINIKCGNSLISRYALDADLKKALRSSKWTIGNYRDAVKTYRNTKSKEVKREMEKLILSIKQDFTAEIRRNDPLKSRLDKLSHELYNRFTGNFIFEPQQDYGKNNKLEKKKKEEQKKLEVEINTISQKMNEIKNNKIYENAFEWRFEFPEVLNDEGDFVGFDVVIGNPPYIQLQYTDYSSQDYFKKFQVFERTGDIFSLFFENSVNVLKEKGILSFITSNRFCNTNYGSSIRAFLSKLSIDVLINMNDIDVFEEANVGTLITIIEKEQPTYNRKFTVFEIKNETDVRNIQELALNNLDSVEQRFFNEKQWMFDENRILELKDKIEKNSILLNEATDIKINRGITTSANDIFLIDRKIGDELIKKNQNNAKILKPVLKGAEIKRYYVKDFNNYIILSKTGISIENYPDVFDYLQTHQKVLEQVYEAKKGMKKWYELRRCSYYESFEKEKLIWTRLSNINSFAISTNNEYSIDSTSFATGDNLKYYCSILNSKVVFFYFKLGSVIWGKDGIKWFGDYFDSIPIPKATEFQKEEIENIISKIITEKQSNPSADITSLETEIDQLVYQLYGLTEEEIRIVEGK